MILTGGNRMLGRKEKGILGRGKMNKYWDDEEWGIVKESKGIQGGGKVGNM